MLYAFDQEDTFVSVLTSLEFGSTQPNYQENMFGKSSVVNLIPARILQHHRKFLVQERHTGSWCYLEPQELDLYLFLDGKDMDKVVRSFDPSVHQEVGEFVARLYWLGLLEVNGRRFFEPEIFLDRPTGPVGPLFLINVTDRCNLACTYCLVNGHPRSGRTMDWETGKRVLDLIMDYPCEEIGVQFHGGEPTLEWDLVDRLATYALARARATGKELDLTVQTNGTLLTREIVFRCLKDRIHLGLSLDGDRSVHDLTRVFPDGSGSFEAIERGIRILQEADFPIAAVCTLTKSNYTHVARFLDVLDEMGAQSVNLNPVLHFGRALDHWEGISLDPTSLLEPHLTYLNRVAQEGTRVIESKAAQMIGRLVTKMHPSWCRRSPCGAGRHFLTFGVDGSIHPCYDFFHHKELGLGHVSRVHRLDNLWLKNPVMRDLQTRRPESLPGCNACTYVRYCEAGCMLHAYSVRGRIDAKDPRCDFYKGMYTAIFENIAEAPHILDLLCPDATVFNRSYRLSASMNLLGSAVT